MLSWRLRPSFRQELELGYEETQERIVEAVESDPRNFEVKSFPGFICLRIPEEERTFWSPRLNLSLESNENGGTRIQGAFGPNANVWSLYLYGYSIVGIVGMFSGMFGACQWFVGLWPWGLWVFFGALVLALALYLASRVGQRLAAPQSELLEKAYVEAIGQEIEIR